MAQDSGVEVVLKPVSTSFEAGKAYLIGFTVRYPCGPSRTIHLEVTAPEWTEAAVDPVFTTRSDRCLEGFSGEFSENILVDVFQDAVEGTLGNISLTARDAVATATAVVEVHVRQVTPRAEIAGLGTVPDVDAESTVTFNLTTTYTLWKPGRIRWIAEAPDGWRVAVPSARATEAGEDNVIVASFAATAPSDANGTARLGIHAVLVNRTGVRIAESAVREVLVNAVPLPDEPEPIDGAGDDSPSEEPRRVPPRAPIWVVGVVLVAAVVGVYALESREERRKP